MDSTGALDGFHPAIRTWFERRFPGGPTEAQALGWASIKAGSDTLIAAPTGSGKTLAGFLVAIDACLRSALEHEAQGTSVVYVSPLRALTVDVRENLDRPLQEIADICVELGFKRPEIRVAVRNGDSTPAARAAIVRDRPEIIVTTPESLYLLVNSARSREVLAETKTVIVDEIHAVARDKRGAHLAITLERLDALVREHDNARPTRIGLSATQRPIETVARLLIGAGAARSHADGSPACEIVDVGHIRKLDLEIVLPSDALGAVMTTDQLDEVVQQLATQIAAHHTTLIFVNTRRMAERLAHQLADVVPESSVAAHHGSLSMERRLSIESRLRAGQLRAVVATASLELGIDVGPIDLVCQLGSPRSIATFLQRVGRAEHRLDGVPKGRIYPFTRDELVECVALFGAVKAGRLDALEPPVAPLDILAQQIVAECAAHEEGLEEGALYGLIKGASPYADLSEDDYESVVELVSTGVTTGRGQRGAHLHRDQVHHLLRPRRGARLVAATSGGAIPELADYKVLLEPEGALIGTVHEDFAVEAMAGDVFLLGSASWRVQRVEQGIVRVQDANGAAPTLPFWLGEAPARTDELAGAISDLRNLVETNLRAQGPTAATHAVREWSGAGRRPADELVAYLATALEQLGALPTRKHLIIERFFDDSGGMQLVVHSPYGARINRGYGLALRKRFCRSFDFELQAAASDDAIVLSLGPQHSFPLEEVTRYLSTSSVTDVLIQAVLPTPIFTSRWRWNLSRSLISPRFRGARHLPPAIQRMEADDLMAAIFPQLAACQENVTGPIEIPDHPIVRQTLHDCCTEAMDLEGLKELIGAIRSGEVAVRCIDTTEASVLSHEILNGRPYTFLDDAPLEERRTRAVSLRRGLPIEAHDLSSLDQAIVAEVSAEILPSLVNVEDLHDLLLSTIVYPATSDFEQLYDLLCSDGRAMTLYRSGFAPMWCATEMREKVDVLFPEGRVAPDYRLDAPRGPQNLLPEHLAAELLAGHLELVGPITSEELALRTGLPKTPTEIGLLALESQGLVLRVLEDKWCAKRIVQRIHSRQRGALRRSYPAVTVADAMRFYLSWQHVGASGRLFGADGLRAVIEQLQGIEAPIGAWEESILPSRIAGYQLGLLDELCSRGEISWGRLSLRSDEPTNRRPGATPSRATPVALVSREHLSWLLAAARADNTAVRTEIGAAGEVIEALSEHGALFFADLCAITGRMPSEIAEALWDGVTRGLVTSDSFQAVRGLLAGRYRSITSPRATPRRPLPALRHARPTAVRGGLPSASAGGRWSVLDAPVASEYEPEELAEAVARQLLERWGVVIRELYARESFALPWRAVLFGLRRLEARGVIRGGRFVAGPVGEQFALPEALDRLRQIANSAPDEARVHLAGADPLNLTGLLLPGPRVPALRGRSLQLAGGLMVGEHDEDRLDLAESS